MSRRKLIAVALAGLFVLALVPTFVPVPVYAATTTFYGDVDDAYIYKANASYSTAWTATSGDGVTPSHTFLYIGQMYDGDYHIQRSAVYYDTSGIPDVATITSAKLKLYVGQDDSDPDFYIVIQNGMPTYPHKPATAGDYNKANYSDNGGQLHTSSIVEETYAEITLSATGLSWISKTGTTKLMLRSSRDINGNTPTGEERIAVYSHNHYVSYGVKAPVLEITYTTPSIESYPPTVSTRSYGDVTNTTAKLYGDVTYVDNGLAIYDDFEWGIDTTPLSDSGGIPTWTVSAAGSSKAEIDTSYHYTGAHSARFYRDSTNNVAAYFTKTALTSTEALSFAIRKEAGAYIAVRHGNGTKYIRLTFSNSGGSYHLYYYDGADHDTGQVISASTWYAIEVANVNWSAGTYDIYVDDYLLYTGATMAASSSYANVVDFVNVGASTQMWIDDVGFRPYVAERGIQYGLTQTPTWSESEAGLFGTGAYSLTVTDLSGGTEYWYRAYVVNAEGTAYGSWAAFTTVDIPSIATFDASNVASTTAQLNSALYSDGADPCTIKFGWGLSSKSHVEDYDTHDTLPGTYTSGSYPYLDVADLAAGYTYYFRVSATNDAGTTEGAELTFETIVTLGPPGNFVGYPEATAISLSWSKGTGATNTLVRYGTTAYPGTTSSGTLAYFGVGSTYTVEDLTSGKTYYFSAWGESGGNYSDTYATFLMTTSAGSGTTPGDIDVPTEPSRWFSAPDYTSMQGLSVLYDAINAAADSGHIPRETAWFLLALGLAGIAGLIAYLKLGHKLLIAMIVLTVGLAFGYFVRLIPWWVPLMSLILVIAFSQTHKQVNEG